MDLARISLRPVVEADADVLLELYSSTRAQELAMVPWNPEQKKAFVEMQFMAQQSHYKAEYPQAEHSMICLDGVPVGRVYLDRRAEEFHILDITVLPQQRNAGVGSRVLRQIMDEATGSGKPVSIYVETFNPSLRLFERLGFVRAQQAGIHFLMKWLPSPERQPEE